MENVRKHWTEQGTPDFIYRIGSDFVSQVESQLEDGTITQKELAAKLGVSEGAVSQVLNKPGNLQLDTMVKYARALGMKVGVLLYDDKDRENKEGPIHPDIFRVCWEYSGRPRNFFELSCPQPTDVASTGEAILEGQDSSYQLVRTKNGVNRGFRVGVDLEINLPSAANTVQGGKNG